MSGFGLRGPHRDEVAADARQAVLLEHVARLPRCSGTSCIILMKGPLLKPGFHMIGARVEAARVPGAFQLWVKGGSTCTAPPRDEQDGGHPRDALDEDGAEALVSDHLLVICWFRRTPLSLSLSLYVCVSMRVCALCCESCGCCVLSAARSSLSSTTHPSHKGEADECVARRLFLPVESAIKVDP